MIKIISIKGYFLSCLLLFSIQTVWPVNGRDSVQSSTGAPDSSAVYSKPWSGFFSVSPGYFRRNRFGDHEIGNKNFGTVAGEGLSLEVLYRPNTFNAVGFTVSIIGNNLSDSSNVDGSYVYGMGLIYYRYIFADQNILPVPGFRIGWWWDGYYFITDPYNYYWSYSFKNIYFGGPCLKFDVGFFRFSVQGELSLLFGVRQLLHEDQNDASRNAVRSSFASCLDLNIGLQYQSIPKGKLLLKTLSKAPPNTVFLDLLGPGGVWALNYERRLRNEYSLRIGFSYWKSQTDWDVARYFIIPYSVNYLLGNATHKLEFGIGSRMLWFFFKEKIETSSGISEETGPAFITSRFDEIIPMVGYRLIAEPIIIRLYFSHVISKHTGSGPGFPWIGASIGYAF